MNIFKPAKFEYPEGWPPEDFFANHMSVTRSQLDQFESLLNTKAKESELDNFLKVNPNIFVNGLRIFGTGHHGAWVIPQQVIRPPLSTEQKGLIPDYILGGHNSDGFNWFVVELKGADQKILNVSNNSMYFTSTVNKAIGQVIEYIDYCAYAQAYLRDSLGLTNFREPRGLIIVGRDSEFYIKRREKFKAAWNRLIGNKIEIRTYDAILRYVRTEVQFQEKKMRAE